MFFGIDFGFLLICAFFGMLGQSIRVFIGVYKIVNEEGTAKLKEKFNFAKLFVSLVLGAICGMLVWFVLTDDPLNRVATLLLVSAGYAGADFIEGFLKKKSQQIS